MPYKRKTPLPLAVLGMTLAVLAASSIFLSTDQRARAADAPAQPPIANELIDVAGQMDKLIRDHKVDELATLSIPADQSVAKLAGWRNDYVTDLKKSEELRSREYDDDVKEAQDLIAKSKYEEAMDKTVQAYLITKDQAAFIELPWLKDLAGKVADQAAKYEKDGHWLESLQLYSDLNNLFEIDVRYKPDMQRLARRTRLLAVYTPKIIFDMRQAYTERLEKEKGPDAATLPKEEPPTFTRWQDQLEKIDIDELYTAVDTARAKWVEGTTYETLLKGGVEALRLFLTTPELAQEFPELAKPEAKDKFNAALDAALAKIDPTGANRITRDEMHDIVDQIMKANDDSVKLPSEVAIMEFTDGAMEKLDPFTAVIWPHEVAEFEKNIRGTFGGVGIQISMETGKLKVVSPLEDTPAFKAGIQAGDEVTAIDGKSTAGINIDTAVHEIMGKPDTQVNLTIKREGKKELIEYTLTRATIHVSTVKGVKRDANDPTKWNYMIDPDTKIGYIRITGFQEETHKEMDDAIEDLKAQNVRGIVLDLRFNPGGLLNAATAMADDFLNASAKPIVSTKGKTMPENKITPEDGTIVPMNLPLVVLVNQYSASASEIFSGAMKDFNRGLVVGQRSFGKGSVQNVIPMDDKSIVKLTTQYYYLPNGESLHRRDGNKTWGVEPDVTVPMTPVQVNALLRARRDSEIIGAAPVPVPEVAPATNPSTQPDVKKDEPLIDTQLDTALLMLRLQLVQQQP